jgi:hypothetical protein
MQTPPEDNPEMFDPQKMLSVVGRLKAEGRMPTMERLDFVLQKHRKAYQDKVREARQARRLARSKK